MAGFVGTMLARLPLAEVLIRGVYWRLPKVRAMVRRNRAMQSRASSTPHTEGVGLTDLIQCLAEQGVVEGDMLIVHAGSSILDTIGASPRDINQALRDLVGPAGIIAMPGFPIFREEPPMELQLRRDVALPEHRYDPARTPIWTGILAMDLLRTPDAIRSTFPINPLIAIGSNAASLFATEWHLDRPTACGLGSAWDKAVQRGAKIVMLGVDIAHSLTLNHYAEDAFDTEWPIANWYRERAFHVKTEAGWTRRQVRERHPRWALHYTEYALNAAIRANGHCTERILGTMPVAVIDARAHIDFLVARRRSAFPYAGIPHRFWKAGL